MVISSVIIFDFANPIPRSICFRLGNDDIVELLIDHNANVNLGDNQRVTSLHWAAQVDSSDVADMLIEHGAKISTKDKYGNTPLNFASFFGMILVFLN